MNINATLLLHLFYPKYKKRHIFNNTRERELDPLRSINDNYEKVMLSMDRSFVNSYEGIKVSAADHVLPRSKAPPPYSRQFHDGPLL